MTDKKGCELREACDLYQQRDLYKNSRLISNHFPDICGTSKPEDFVMGYCPMYDHIIKSSEYLIDTLVKSLKGVNNLIKKLNESLKK